MDPMNDESILLHGPSYAGYVKSVRLVLEEKAIPYRLLHFDFPGRPDGFDRLNPFGKVPVLQHGDFVLYEATAIARYVDGLSDAPALQPAAPRARARMDQALSILDQVGAPAMLRTVFSGRFRERVLRVPHEEAAIADALPRCALCLAAFEQMLTEAGSGYLAGGALSLADLFVAPNLAYFVDTSEGEAMLRRHPALTAWFARLRERPSVVRVGLPELPAPKDVAWPPP